MSMRTIADEKKTREYFVEQLREGTRLARLVLEKIDLSRGRFRVGIPDHVDQSKIDFRFSIPGLREEERAFAKLIKKFIENTGGTALVEDNESVDFYSDLTREPYAGYLMRYGREVYWRIDDSILSVPDIVQLLHSPILPYPLCIFLHLAESVGKKSEMYDADLEQIIVGLVGVAVGAFDTESYLLWWRDDVLPFSTVAQS